MHNAVTIGVASPRGTDHGMSARVEKTKHTKFAQSKSKTHPHVRPTTDTCDAVHSARSKRRGSGMKMGS